MFFEAFETRPDSRLLASIRCFLLIFRLPGLLLFRHGVGRHRRDGGFDEGDVVFREAAIMIKGCPFCRKGATTKTQQKHTFGCLTGCGCRSGRRTEDGSRRSEDRGRRSEPSRENAQRRRRTGNPRRRAVVHEEVSLRAVPCPRAAAEGVGGAGFGERAAGGDQDVLDLRVPCAD